MFRGAYGKTGNFEGYVREERKARWTYKTNLDTYKRQLELIIFASSGDAGGRQMKDFLSNPERIRRNDLLKITQASEDLRKCKVKIQDLLKNATEALKACYKDDQTVIRWTMDEQLPYTQRCVEECKTSLNEVDSYIEQLEATLARLEAKTLRKDPEEARKKRRKKENKHKIIQRKVKRLSAKEDGRSEAQVSVTEAQVSVTEAQVSPTPCRGVTGKSLEKFREMVKKIARE